MVYALRHCLFVQHYFFAILYALSILLSVSTYCDYVDDDGGGGTFEDDDCPNESRKMLPAGAEPMDNDEKGIIAPSKQLSIDNV